MLIMDKMNSSTHFVAEQNFIDDIFKFILFNKYDHILIQISKVFIPDALIDNRSVLAQIMAWCLTDDKPLPEPMLPKLSSPQ